MMEVDMRMATRSGKRDGRSANTVPDAVLDRALLRLWREAEADGKARPSMREQRAGLRAAGVRVGDLRIEAACDRLELAGLLPDLPITWRQRIGRDSRRDDADPAPVLAEMPAPVPSRRSTLSRWRRLTVEIIRIERGLRAAVPGWMRQVEERERGFGGVPGIHGG